jgi:hypothetical protein
MTVAVAESRMRRSRWSELLVKLRDPLPDLYPVLTIVGFVLLANFPYLSGLFDPNPLGRLSGIGAYAGLWDQNPIVTATGVSPGMVPGLLGGLPALDPSGGTQGLPFGHLAALDWTHLRVPWWNPFEGTGAPLAGEMQSAAMFPLTFLLLLGKGQVYELVVFELIAGVSTYFLLRRISVSRWASVAGAVAFALNGTFAWFSHAPVNPVAFLPLLLLGIEIAFGASTAARRGGWWLIAVAEALSIYAGFPETAYIDGLLAVFWFGWRCGCVERQRLRVFATKVAVGAGVGLLLSAPLLIAVVDDVIHAIVGSHTGGVFGTIRLPHSGLAQLVFPYVYGLPVQFLAPQAVGGLWTQVGGYLSVSLLFFGLLGLVSPGRKGLRLMLGAWILLAGARMYGEPPLLGDVLGVLPAMSNVAFFRYATPSLELPVIVLAAVGLDGLVANRIPRRRVLAVTAGAFIIFGLATLEALPVARAIPQPAHRVWSKASVLWGAAVLAVAGVVVFVRNSRARRLLATAIVCVEALVLFVIPELSAPRRIFIDTAPATFLQRHLGLSRFFTLGPLAPNFGSYYTLGQLNVNDNPVSKVLARYIATRLDPMASPYFFLGSPVNAGDVPEKQLESHLDGYRTAGVRYILTPRSVMLPQGAKTFTLVLRTETSSIYRLAGTKPYFTATSPGCVVKPRGRGSVRLSCPRATTLIRRETYQPGWSAAVDGHPTPVRMEAGVFQAVTVPRGTHVVTFGYAPPHIEWAVAAFILGCLSLLLPPWWARARRNPRVRSATRRLREEREQSTPTA